MPQRLGVNVDHVATLRQARKSKYPDPVTAARSPSWPAPNRSPFTCAKTAATFRRAT